MNKNEFYKQLMSEYSFDADKIKSNAKKGRFAKQKALPIYLGITAAAAALVVAAGTAIFTMLDGGRGVDLIQQSDLTSLSAAERLQRALDEIEQNAGSSELKDVLVTFTAPLYPEQAQSVLTAYSDGSIPVKQVYFTDGSRAVGSEQVAAAFSGSRQITGAVINCAGSVMAQLQENELVFAVEIVTEGDIENNVTPIDTLAAETSEITFPDNMVALPVIPSETVTVESEEHTSETEHTEESGESVETADTVDTVDTAETSDRGETLEEHTQEAEPSDTSETIGTEPPAQSAEAPEIILPDKPAEPSVTLPDGVVLPGSAEKFSYETGDLGAESAFFITENTFFVKTADSVRLYTFDGSTEKLVASENCIDAKVCWISENGGRMIVSGTDANGNRNRLLYIDAYGEIILDLHAKDTVMDGTLVDVGYNEESGILVMNIKEYGVYYICTLSLESSGYLDFMSACFESSSKVTLLASNGNNVYLAVNDGSLTQIYRVDAEGNDPKLIKTYDSNPKLSSNLAFTHGIISPSDSAVVGSVEIFDPASESFISTGYFNASVNFGISKHSYSAGGNYYTVSGGSISSAGGISVIGKIDYAKSLSSLYAASASGGKVKITESVYSAKAKSGLIFGEFSDNASAEIRAAVNGAIGVNNAMAQGKCRESGITTNEKLSQCIDVYYTQSAASALKSKCGISNTGALKYIGNSLTAFSVSDTIITVNVNGSTASGTLYVKSGSYGGTPGYVSYNIKLAMENGSWKLDCIFE